MDIETTATRIVEAAIKIHRTLGPGLLESAYQKCMAYELHCRGSKARCEVPLPIKYEKIQIESGFRVDMIVDDLVIIENKTVERIAAIHQAQLLTYLKLTGLHVGFLLNWNETLMKKGIHRFVHGL
jgi:GxxExxY protein